MDEKYDNIKCPKCGAIDRQEIFSVEFVSGVYIQDGELVKVSEETGNGTDRGLIRCIKCHKSINKRNKIYENVCNAFVEASP